MQKYSIVKPRGGADDEKRSSAPQVGAVQKYSIGKPRGGTDDEKRSSASQVGAVQKYSIVKPTVLAEAPRLRAGEGRPVRPEVQGPPFLFSAWQRDWRAAPAEFCESLISEL